MSRNKKSKVLHIVSDSFVFSETSHTGGSKGIKIFHQYLESRQISFEEILAPKRSDSALLRLVKKIPLDEYGAFLIHYPFYPRTFSYLKKMSPETPLIVRSHNAEFLHRLDHARAWIIYRNPVNALKYALRAPSKLWQEWRCASRADYVLAITPWELRNYWAYLAPEKKIKYVPYFTPSESAPTDTSHPRDRELLVVCPMAGHTSALLIDAGRHFYEAVRGLGASRPEWRFCITGRTDGIPGSCPPRVEQTGFVDDMAGLLNRAIAIAVLSDYGYGFKTKVLEAIEHGCRVLIAPKLYARLPSEVQPFCTVVDNRTPDSFAKALDVLERKDMVVQGKKISTGIKQQAITTLDEIFLGVRDESGRHVSASVEEMSEALR